ncbi:MAG: hypothetical protein L0Y56_16140, partial [Nitrospira sp.]|nr:hypothetical protein [Nitrospira sp.]
MGFTKTTGFLSIICLSTLSLLILTGDEPKKGPGPHALPFDVYQVIEKVTHQIKQDPQDPHKYIVESSFYQGEFDSEEFVYKAKGNNELNQKGPNQQEQALRFSFSTIRLGPENLVDQDAKTDPPTAQENQVIYHRAEGIREIYEARKIGVEQSWEIQNLPTSIRDKRNDLVIEGQITTHLIPKLNDRGGIDFFDQDGNYVVSYSQATVVDATGKRLEVPSVLMKDKRSSSHRVALTLPHSWLTQATFPIVVDPLIGTTDTQISTVTATDDWPAVAFDGTNYLVVWQSGTPNAAGTGSTSIVGTRVNTSGVVVDTPINISVTTSQDEMFPAIACDATNNRCLVAYTRHGTTAQGFNMYVRSVTTNVTPPAVSAENAVETLNRDEVYPSIACCDANNFYLLYVRNTSVNGQLNELRGAVINRTSLADTVLAVQPTGTVAGLGPFSNTGLPSVRPKIVFTNTTLNRYLYTWETFGVDTTGNISGNTLLYNGTTTYTPGTQFNIAATDPLAERFPDLAFDSTNFLVTWQRGAVGSIDVTGRFVTPTGTFTTLPNPPGTGAEFTISSNAVNDQTTPGIAFNGTNYLVTWRDARTSTTNRDIYGTGVTPAGVVLNTNGVIITTGVLNEQNPALAAGGSNFLVGWSDSRAGGTNLNIFSYLFGPPQITSLSVGATTCPPTNPCVVEALSNVTINSTLYGTNGTFGSGPNDATNYVTVNGFPPIQSGATWGPNTITFSAQPNGSNVAPGPVTVTAQNWASTPSTANLTIQDFTISSSPPSDQTISAGSPVTYNLLLNRIQGFASNVSLSMDPSGAPSGSLTNGCPNGATCVFTPATILGPGGTTAQLTITTSASTPQTTYTLLVRGTSATNGSNIHLATIGLTVTPPPPTVGFSLTSSSGAESVTPANLAVALSSSSSQTVTVNYAVTAGTATGSGVDYTLADGTLTFNPGVTTQNIPITIVDDALDEVDETIQVTLSAPV